MTDSILDSLTNSSTDIKFILDPLKEYYSYDGYIWDMNILHELNKKVDIDKIWICITDKSNYDKNLGYREINLIDILTLGDLIENNCHGRIYEIVSQSGEHYYVNKCPQVDKVLETKYNLKNYKFVNRPSQFAIDNMAIVKDGKPYILPTLRRQLHDY